MLREGYDQHDDAMTPLKYRNWQRRILAECCRVAGPEGLIAYNHKPRLQDLTLYRLGDIVDPPLPDGWTLRQEIVWDKGSSNNQGRKYLTSLPDTTERVFPDSPPKTGEICFVCFQGCPGVDLG